MSFVQTERLLALDSPLGPDKLLLESFYGTESISQMFHFKLSILSEDNEISHESIVGKEVTVKVRLPDGERHVHGLINQFGRGENVNRFTRYYASLVPQLWKHTQTFDCRIFQEKSVPDIVEQVIKDLGAQSVKNKLTGTYDPRVYCVQYRESDFDFISRLLEEEGIHYYFVHSDGNHELVLADAPDCHTDCPIQASASYAPSGGSKNADTVLRWEHRARIRAGKYTHTDYNFETPQVDLKADKDASGPILSKHKDLEYYDFPGNYAKKPEGDRYASLRIEEQETPQAEINGTSSCRSLVSGHLFELTDHEAGEENGKYLLTSVSHEATSNVVTGEASYHNSFVCVPEATKYRPARVTPRPIVHGLQSAVVVGPSGEEIWTDKYGRIKVQFHWDREGEDDENSSCWLRVSQPCAGKGWGAHFWPRIGHEVLVAFLEGDPDRPIVVGNVYNADNMPPYELPANQTRSGYKSRSSKEGSSSNFNELRFEDKKGEEEIYLHAEKDLNCVVENDHTLKVGFDKKDPGDQTIEIYNNRTETVKEGNEKVTIEKGNRDITVKTGNDTHKVDKGNRTVEIGMGNDSLTIKMGNRTTKLDLGKSTTEAMQSIELKVGQSSIKVDQMGVTIKGMMVKVEGQMMTDVKGMMTKVNGDAMLKMGGGITMIG